MSAQRGSSAVEAAHRSVYPNIAGVPWWTALLIAVTTTAIGYGIDAGSGHKQLTGVFAALYIAGCVAAVLAVRQDSLFTAVIQPPLILFCAVPGAYWLFHGGQLGSIKDLLINCGYPLIERFPLMLGSAGAILAIGLARWYFGMSHRTAADERSAAAKTEPAAGAKSFFLSSVSAKLNSLLGVGSDENDAANDGDDASSTAAKRARSPRPAQRTGAGTARGTRNGRPSTRSTRAGSRSGRPRLDDEHDPTPEPRRRRRPAAPREFDPADPPRRSRRRPGPQDDADPRGRDPYERSAPRGSRFDGYDRYDRHEPPAAAKSANRYAPYESYDSYEPPAEPRRRRTASNETNGTGSSHHPISQVRYRGPSPDEERAERRGRPRTPGRSQGPSRADSWEYDA